MSRFYYKLDHQIHNSDFMDVITSEMQSIYGAYYHHGWWYFLRAIVVGWDSREVLDTKMLEDIEKVFDSYKLKYSKCPISGPDRPGIFHE